MQFLIGCAHLRKQPSFQDACETAFERCRNPLTSHIGREQLADVLRSSMLELMTDNGVSRQFASCNISNHLSSKRHHPVSTHLSLPTVYITDDEAVQDVGRRR